MRTVIELFFRGGDRKFKYDTQKKQQVQLVIRDLKETTLGKARKSVFQQIMDGDRVVTGTPRATAAMQQPEAEQLHINTEEGYTPPEEQMAEFLTNERYERRQILPTVTGGAWRKGLVGQYLSDQYREELIKAWYTWIDAWKAYWMSTFRLWSAYVYPSSTVGIKDDLGSCPTC